MSLSSRRGRYQSDGCVLLCGYSRHKRKEKGACPRFAAERGGFAKAAIFELRVETTQGRKRGGSTFSSSSAPGAGRVAGDTEPSVIAFHVSEVAAFAASGFC